MPELVTRAYRPGPSDWPNGEESAYVDWWKQVENNGGARDSLSGLTFARETQVEGDGGAITPFRVTSRGDAARSQRFLPMWPVALGPKADQVAGDVEFGDPIDAFGTHPKAIIVVIDTDINPLQERFRSRNGAPRICAHWLMEAPFLTGSNRVIFGRELRQDDFQAVEALTEDTALGRLGCQVLEMAQAPRGTALMEAHGTHVLDLAAGTDPMRSDAENLTLRDVPILAVSLPSNRILSPSGVFLDVFVDQALSWVQQRLTELLSDDATKWPTIAINLSYGLSAGPKDGSDPLPKRLKAFLGKHPSAKLFMPAGNDGLGKARASLTATREDETGIGWQVAAGNPFSTYAEVWFQADADLAGLTMTLSPPNGPAAVIFPREASTAQEICPEGKEDPIARAYVLGAPNPGDRLGLILCVAPTQPHRTDRMSAPPGHWRLQVSRTASPVRLDVELQSERALRPNDNGSRPSQLVNDHKVDASPCGTLNASAVESGAVIVAGYRCSDKQPVAWGSRGDLTNVPNFAPSVAFPADRSPSRPGLIAAGYRSGSSAIVQGTSFSTALATRHFVRHVLDGGSAAAWTALIAPPVDTPAAVKEHGYPCEVRFDLTNGLIAG